MVTIFQHVDSLNGRRLDFALFEFIEELGLPQFIVDRTDSRFSFLDDERLDNLVEIVTIL